MAVAFEAAVSVFFAAAVLAGPFFAGAFFVAVLGAASAVFAGAFFAGAFLAGAFAVVSASFAGALAVAVFVAGAFFAAVFVADLAVVFFAGAFAEVFLAAAEVELFFAVVVLVSDAEEVEDTRGLSIQRIKTRRHFPRRRLQL